MENPGYTLWFPGMSGPGKRTLAGHPAERFRGLGRPVQLLTTTDIEPFFPVDVEAPLEVRNRVTRLLGWVAELLTRQGAIVFVADVSPIREVREETLRKIGRFAEIFVDCSFDVLVQRDSDRIYERAMAGELQNVVGVQLPYEPPRHPDVWVDSSETAPEMLAAKLIDGLFSQGFLNRTERDVLLGELDPSALLAPVVEMRPRRTPPPPIGAGTPEAEGPAASPAKRATRSTPKKAARPAVKKAAAKSTAKKAAAKPAKKAAAKSTAKKAATKPAKKAATKLTAKKAATKPAKKAATKSTAKKTAAKPTARKATAKSTPKKAATKSTARKTTTTKPAAKKTAAKSTARKTAAKATAKKTTAKT